jgi:hypothetical protein
MIWRYFDDPNEFEAARLDGTCGLFRRHSQFGSWATWFSQDRGFLAQPLMPVHHRNSPDGASAL